MNESETTSRLNLFISGDTEMAIRIRAYPWKTTTLGAIENWSETLLATVNLMLHSPFPTVVGWGPDLIFLYNDAAIATLTAKHPAALGGRYRDVFSEAWDVVGGDLQACLHEGRTAVRDNMFIPILIDGVLEDHYWSYSLIPVYENGRIAGVYDAFRNMTEMVLSAKRLRESEDRLKLATEVAELGVFLWDTVSDQGTWENDRMYELFGRQREAGPVNGAEFLREVLHPDFREAFQEAVAKTLRHGEPLHFEGLVYRGDGQVRCMEVNGRLAAPGMGRDGLILGTIRDVTRLRETKRALQESAKHSGELAAIVASSEDVILSKNLNGIITSWNDAATRVFGYTADEMVGTSILRLIPEDLQSDEKLIIENIRAGRRVEHFETVRMTKDGRRIDVSLTVSPVKDAQGRVIGASKILRDVSSRKRLEQSLIQAEKIAATGRMAATIAHEINNPLESVMNLLYLLRRKVTDAEGMSYLHTAESELERVSHIAKQTLGFYRENAAASRISLSEIVEQALSIYGPRCLACGIEVHQALHSAAKIMLRRGEMMQVISNLLANSIHAMADGGTLSVSVEDADAPAGVTLRVADNGVGIEPKTLPRIFDAFFTTRATVGTGIGLFVAKQFVEAHGGQISVQSRVDGQCHGTEIKVFLPLHTTYERDAANVGESGTRALSMGAGPAENTYIA